MVDEAFCLHEVIVPEAPSLWGPAERFPLSGSSRRPLRLPDGDETTPFGLRHLILSGPNLDVPLERVHSVYYRRPGRFDLSIHRHDDLRRFVEAEARQGFGGVLSSLDCTWVNHPARMADAEYKPCQLKVAAESGLRVPRSHLTNDPRSAKMFAEAVGGMVVDKPLSAHRFWVENGRSFVLLTSPIQLDSICDPRIGITAHLFQEWVPKHHDVRLTVVGGRFFAVAIDVGGSTAALIDWRANHRCHRYLVTTVPDEVRAGVRSLLDRLGLVFGALDFSVTEEGEWFFLELNPGGQWGWIEAATGLPIASAIADALEAGSMR